MLPKIRKFFKKKSLYPFFLRIFGRIGKRRRFIAASFILTVIFLISSFFTYNEAKFLIGIIAIMTYFLTFFALLEGISGIEWLMLFLVPVYFTAAYYLFYFFFPGRWLTRLPYSVVYAISIYAIMLASNIFNVGATKSLQLFRAALSINYLYLTITTFLTYNLILSFRFGFIANFLLVFLATFPLAWQFIWAINPRTNYQGDTVNMAALLSLIIAEGALVMSFVPMKPTILALLLTAGFYSLAGLFQAHVENRLFKERVREYLFVLIFVFIVAMLSIRW